MTFWDYLDKHMDRVEFKHVIAMVVVIGTFWIFYLVMFCQLPVDADKYAPQIITSLTSVLTMVLGYWFISTPVPKRVELPTGTVQEINSTSTTTITTPQDNTSPAT